MHPIFARIGLIAATFAIAGAAPAAEPVHMRMVGDGKNCWVLVHAFGASGDFWQQRAPELAQRHHVRVYYPDLPSHGLSALTPTFNYTMATDAVQAALKPVCPRPEMIIGGSSGGIIAMRLGARMHARRVVGVSVGWSFNEADIKDLINSGEHPAPDFLDYLKHFAVQGGPQVVIHGDKDDFFFPPSMAKLVRSIPGTQLHLFPGAGHLDPLRKPFADVTWELIDRYSETGTIGRSSPLPP